MLDSLFQSLIQYGSWPVYLALIVVWILCYFGFQFRAKKLNGVKVFDGRRKGYTAAEAKQILDDLGPDGRRLYAITQLTLDVVFPLAFGGLLFFAIAGTWRSPEFVRYFQILPILAVVTDLLENLLTTYMAGSYKGTVSPIVGAASVVTQVKWSAYLLSLASIIVGLIFMVVNAR